MTDPPVVDGLLDTLPCGVVSFGDDGRIVYANGTFGTMLGTDASELAGRHVETLLMVAGSAAIVTPQGRRVIQRFVPTP